MDSDEIVYKYEGWLRVVKLIIPYFFIISVFHLIGYLIAGVDFSNLESEETSVQKIIIQILSLLGTFFTLWLFMKHIDKQAFLDLGLHIKNRLRDFIQGSLIGFVLIALGVALLVILKEISNMGLDVNFKEIFLSIVLFIIVAITEEALVRGYILKNLMVSFNKYIALIVSSILFSILHCLNPNIDFISFLNLFLAGLLLGLPYIYTKNLWFPIGLHFSWNLIQSLTGFNVSGLEHYSIVSFTIEEPNFWNGGSFGLEGSVIAITLQVIAILILYYRRSKFHSITYLTPSVKK